jgi:hypothetical protein
MALSPSAKVQPNRSTFRSPAGLDLPGFNGETISV